MREPSFLLLFILLLLLLLPAGYGPSGSDAAAAAAGEWSVPPLSPMPTDRTEVTSATVGSSIYVMGGFDSRGDTVDTVEVYDPRSNTWSEAKELPLPLHHAAAASDGDTLYVVGGYLEGWIPSNKLFIHDQERNEWREGGSMPTPRGALTAQFVDGLLYAVGGWNGLPLRTNEAYDPSTNSWKARAEMPTAREHLASGTADGKLYVIGGRQGGMTTNLNVNEEYDPETDQWRARAPMPSNRGGIVGASLAGSIYVFGGETPVRTFDNNEQYVAEFDRWIVRERMPTARHGLAASEAGGTVYVIGGGVKPGLSVSGKNESFTPGDWRRVIDVQIRPTVMIDPATEEIGEGEEIRVTVGIRTPATEYVVSFGEFDRAGNTFTADVTIIPPTPVMAVKQVATDHRHSYILSGLEEGDYRFEVLVNGMVPPAPPPSSSSSPPPAEPLPSYVEFTVGTPPLVIETPFARVVEVKSGQELVVERDVEYGGETLQPYAYILQVKDSGGVTISLSWVEGELFPEAAARISQTWTPESSGMHTLELFVWDGIRDPEVLAPMHALAVSVA